ncbi:MAG: type II toxin-antitoxin system HicB family antitoxin [Chloroflexi bacterium]|nr:type II toxin-antitoxin system HicB family antitoxin [Chloroflexota bacterium]
MREFTVIVERDEVGWLVGSVPALRGCHTQASNLEELLENIREAILLCLEVEHEDEINNLTLVGVHRVGV